MLVFLLFELGQNPVGDVLQCDILDDLLVNLSSDVMIAAGALASCVAFLEVANYAVLAKGAHALVDCVSVAIDSLT